MKLPADCKLSISSEGFDGLLRPREFFCVAVESGEAKDVVFIRHVLMHPFLLRLRLLIAMVQCLRMVRKFKKLQKHLGI